jgi:multidrug efflux system outer membrane protein
MAALLVLAGCSFAPTYERPALAVPDAWPEDVKASAAPTKAVDWASFFPDERLRALIKLSFEHNRDLRIATARVAEARAVYGIQRADRLPTLNVGGSLARSRTPADLSSTGASNWISGGAWPASARRPRPAIWRPRRPSDPSACP